MTSKPYAQWNLLDYAIATAVAKEAAELKKELTGRLTRLGRTHPEAVAAVEESERRMAIYAGAMRYRQWKN